MTDPVLQGLLNTASRLREAGNLPQAIAAYRTLLTAFPDLPESWYNLGVLLKAAGEPADALAAYDEALRRNVSDPQEVHLNRGVIFSDLLSRPDDARSALHTSLSIAPDYLPALINLANLEEDLGRRDAAAQTYERALAIAPENATVLSRYAGLAKTAAPDDANIVRLKQTIANGKNRPADLALLQFALGRLHDTAGDYAAAYETIEKANQNARMAASGSVSDYNLQAEFNRADRSAAAFSAAQARTGGLSETNPAPVFILGMFRSGSTLIEQVLAGHSQVSAGGELDMLPRIARGLGDSAEGNATAPAATIREYAEAYLTRLRLMFPAAGVVTDKRPDNFWHVGLIKRLFPSAKIINTVRHPLDTLISVWGLYLDASLQYSFKIEDIAGHILAERRMLAHWNQLFPGDILTVNYETLVRAPESEVRRVLTYLELPFEPACLAFHQSRLPVRTASVWQVREPLNDRSIGRWKNYERMLRARPEHPALQALLAVETAI